VNGCGASHIHCIVDRIWPGVPQPDEWQRIGNQVDAAMIFAGTDFVKVHRIKRLFPSRNRIPLRSQIISQFHLHLHRRLTRASKTVKLNQAVLLKKRHARRKMKY
jgi:hypothetical protein